VQCYRMTKSFLYQINVTRDCNLRCTHCYIHSEVKDSSKTMQEQQLLDIANGIVEHMSSINYSHAEIHIIGGEPTMLGLAFYEKMMPELRKTLSGNEFTFEILLVSNLLHNDVVKIAKLFDRISTSYEPETRFVSWTGQPKPALERLWLEKVSDIQSAGLNLSVTTAITKPVISFGAGNLLDWFYSKGIKQIHFGFFIPEGDGLVNIATVFPEFHETSDFLISCAEWYWGKRETDQNLWVNPVESMLSAIHTNTPLDDIVCPIIAGSMDIHWDGSAAPCLEAGGAINPDWAGNVFKDGINGVAQSLKFKQQTFAAIKPHKSCRSCDEYSVCKSGCGVLFKFWNAEEDLDCPGFKKFIKYLRKKHAEGLIPRYTEYTGVRSC
jgi:radical SAM protein with 4Fe4S-binding SPASM domain